MSRKAIRNMCEIGRFCTAEFLILVIERERELLIVN